MTVSSYSNHFINRTSLIYYIDSVCFNIYTPNWIRLPRRFKGVIIRTFINTFTHLPHKSRKTFKFRGNLIKKFKSFCKKNIFYIIELQLLNAVHRPQEVPYNKREEKSWKESSRSYFYKFIKRIECEVYLCSSKFSTSPTAWWNQHSGHTPIWQINLNFVRKPFFLT